MEYLKKKHFCQLNEFCWHKCLVLFINWVHYSNLKQLSCMNESFEDNTFILAMRLGELCFLEGSAFSTYFLRFLERFDKRK